LKLRTITWSDSHIVLIDQTKLPEKLNFMHCRNVRQLHHAIQTLKVRGAPAIGAAAALGMVLGLHKKKLKDYHAFKKEADKLYDYLAGARPTAVNLVWALKRMSKVLTGNKEKSIEQIKKALFQEANAIIEEDRRSCRLMAEHAQKVVKNNDRIMTYCNAGMLATIDYGTALGVIYRAKELKKKLKVYACETRPLLQGARLTCWELKQKKIDVTLICDNTAGYLMSQKKIDKIFVGADRIAVNGDAANKIGSYSLAVLANYHKVPFYVVAPHSTFDTTLKNGAEIPIETRSAQEIRSGWYKKPMVCKGVGVYNPAFDVIPNKLITGIITDSGIIKPPYLKKIKKRIKS